MGKARRESAKREGERRHQIPCAGDGEKRRMDMEVNKSENVIYRRNICNIILNKHSLAGAETWMGLNFPRNFPCSFSPCLPYVLKF